MEVISVSGNASSFECKFLCRVVYFVRIFDKSTNESKEFVVNTLGLPIGYRYE